MSLADPAQKPAPTLLVRFSVGHHDFAVPLDDVQEIAAIVAVTPLPGAERHLLGVIDYHGTPCTVIDVRYLLHLPSRQITPEQHLLILRAGDRVMAIPSDRALGVLAEEVRSSPARGAGGSLVAGLVQDQGEVVLVLSSSELLGGARVGKAALKELAGNSRANAGNGAVG